jgi:hypothetical protein
MDAASPFPKSQSAYATRSAKYSAAPISANAASATMRQTQKRGAVGHNGILIPAGGADHAIPDRLADPSLASASLQILRAGAPMRAKHPRASAPLAARLRIVACRTGMGGVRQTLILPAFAAQAN